MKFHLPSSLRSALLACFSVSPIVVAISYVLVSNSLAWAQTDTSLTGGNDTRSDSTKWSLSLPDDNDSANIGGDGITILMSTMANDIIIDQTPSPDSSFDLSTLDYGESTEKNLNFTVNQPSVTIGGASDITVNEVLISNDVNISIDQSDNTLLAQSISLGTNASLSLKGNTISFADTYGAIKSTDASATLYLDAQSTDGQLTTFDMGDKLTGYKGKIELSTHNKLIFNGVGAFSELTMHAGSEWVLGSGTYSSHKITINGSVDGSSATTVYTSGDVNFHKGSNILNLTGHVTFDVKVGTKLTLQDLNWSLAKGNVLIKEGEGDLHFFGTSASGVLEGDIIIAEGSITAFWLGSKANFNSMEIKEGASFNRNGFVDNSIAKTFIMSGGVYNNDNGTAVTIDTLQLKEAASTMNFKTAAHYTITSLEGSNALASMDFLGAAGSSVTIKDASTFNGTIIGSATGPKVYVEKINNDANSTPKFTGTVFANALVKDGDGDAIFETLIVLENGTFTKNGAGKLTAQQLDFRGTSMQVNAGTVEITNQLNLNNGQIQVNAGLLSLTGSIVLNESGQLLVNQGGEINFGSTALFDVSALDRSDFTYDSVTGSLIFQILNGDGVSNIASLDGTNISGLFGDSVFAGFNADGSVSITMLNDILVNQTSSPGNSFDLSTLDYGGSTEKNLNFLVDQASLTIGGESNITVNEVFIAKGISISIDQSDNQLLAQSISLGTDASLRLKGDTISLADAYGAIKSTDASATLYLDAQSTNGQSTTFDMGDKLTGYKGKIELSTHNKLIFNGVGAFSELTMHAGSEWVLGSGTYSSHKININGSVDGSSATTIYTSANVNFHAGSNILNLTGHVTFDVKASTVLTLRDLNWSLAEGNVLIKKGEGNLHFFGQSASGVLEGDIIIAEGSITAEWTGNKTNFNSIEIKEGASFNKKRDVYNSIAKTFIMSGGDYNNDNGSTSTIDTLQLKEAASTMNFNAAAHYTITSLEGSNALASMDFLGAAGSSVTIKDASTFNGTIIGLATGPKVYVEKINNDANSTPKFKGTVFANALVKDGAGDAIFETLNVLANGTFTKNGTGKLAAQQLNFRGTSMQVNAGTVEISNQLNLNNEAGTSAEGRSVSVSSNARISLLGNANITVGGMSITATSPTRIGSYLTGNKVEGTIADHTLSHVVVNNANIAVTSQLVLNNVVLNNTNVRGGQNITATNLSIGTAAVGSSANNSLTYTITNLDGMTTTLEGSLTLNIQIDNLSQLTEMLTQGGDIFINIAGIDATTTDLENLDINININDQIMQEITGSFVDVDGKSYLSIQVIPEPSSATLSLLALAGLLARRRRKV